ncbi:3-phosphoshikimate 1-carboxyvinyltransferase [Kineosphaera limosa]|uniref:3-phosphoshikimate 1-carboxyvinyltransferase n=1 Tax=Kineosphaera limosa NBRC 100340 TaxID=1184609 RepID=K6WTG6_9MICO|nr:3-phosphoshikimate 1-carboxyvinyltransferase [Kineosphaera limosa]NYE02548.1 3-phosphoshikimate 1-carboxyvinyltransferase [Kineosphaera limosa]GAB97151.1 3-phosphoshikimate 1-carboxyvinyltransferase [Kineosphaera limosa NBRC 100340]
MSDHREPGTAADDDSDAGDSADRHLDPWPAPPAAGAFDAVVQLPGSKSLTNRFLVLAALAGDTSRIRRPLRSRDTLLMADALRSLGARIDDIPGDEDDCDDWLVEPGPIRGQTSLDCGLAGTVMRFLPPVAALADGPVRFDGDAHARKRPMRAGLLALRALGVDVRDEGRAALPFTVVGTGAVRGGRVSLDASSSSQFISALLLTGARFTEGVEVVHVGDPVPSEPHVAMTVEVLRDAGVDVEDHEPDRWRVAPSTIHALDVQVEPDLSNAAPFLAAAMVTGSRIHLPGWPQYTTQAGDELRDILDAMGGDVSLSREGLTLTGPPTIHGVDLDLHDAGELAPVVAALAALADSPSRLRGIAHLRGHETDRLAALATEIGKVGGTVEVLPDGLTIRPARRPSAARLATYADHRMAMAAAVLGLAAPGTLVEDVGTVGKTLPTFTRLWADMLGQTQRNGEIAQESVEKRGQGSGQDAPRSRGASTRNGGA